ncbi:phosphatidylglycerophosphatase A [Pelomonas sp. Root1444]|uniref:phosphatidylglycerophosphatase A family protein n=1 Tax=Pelomonas sp. Root1444 TaxID=1736464 RepID=UPI000703527A|nr:phosphatidylglycerophosphatase A [Pelomonas sp. Root1444]KQY90445.1 phosphatidylglycerophosphatase [Pelomonas sp. Root1444]
MNGAPVRPTPAFMLRHPARWLALGFGSGLSPKAPGTVGTLWAWLAWWVLSPWLDDRGWALLIGVGTLVGWWACTRTARDMHTPDPGAIVWDEVLAFWLVLWLIAPAGVVGQIVAFGLFRFFDAAKPGPVGWADRLFKGERGGRVTWGQGFGILFDDFVAAGCTLAVIALYRALLG